VERIYNIWTYYRKPAYSHFINVPHMVRYPASHKFFKAELEVFKRSLEAYSGREISPQGLRQATQLHNENRALLRKLSQMRKEDPPLVSGSEMTEVMIAGSIIPADEFQELLTAAIEDATTRSERPPKTAVRVLVYGAELDDAAFIRLIEESGANVVIDDHCLGTRNYWRDVDLTDDPLDGITSNYLENIRCPRTYRDTPGTYQADMENRFSYLRDYVKEYNVNGVIAYIYRFCDTHELDLPEIRDYLEAEGLPFLHLEEDYDISAAGRLKTRVQAFLEMIE